MLSGGTRIPPSLGYSVFSQPEICLGDQSKISLLVTTSRNLGCRARRHFLGRKAELPGVVIRLLRPIGGTATMACDLPAHRRGRSIEASGHLTHRRARSDPARDVLALGPCEG